MSESPLPVKNEPRIPTSWLKQLIITCTVISWIVLAWFALWGLSQIIGAMFLILLASFICSLLSPLAHLLQRIMPLALTKLLLALVLVVVCILFALLITRILRTQLVDAITLVQSQFVSTTPPTPIQQVFIAIGISPEQILQFKLQLVTYIRNGISSLDAARSLVQVFTMVLVVATLGLSFLFDTAVFDDWLRHHTPMSQRKWVTMLLSTVERGTTSSLQGMLMLSLVGSILIGGVAALFRVPFAILIAVIAFFLQFFSAIGELLIVLIGGLLASPQGWNVAIPVMLLIILILASRYVINVIISPRLLGKATGLHPTVALLTLLVGGQLFGFWGTLLSLPVARFLQDILETAWSTWRLQYPEEFPESLIADG